jgi:hypothetical protein
MKVGKVCVPLPKGMEAHGGDGEGVVMVSEEALTGPPFPQEIEDSFALAREG